MTEWAPGMACRVVPHDPVTREPKPGGCSEATTVERVTGGIAEVTTKRWGLMSFRPDGWPAWTGEYRWRLLPCTGNEEAATAARQQED